MLNCGIYEIVNRTNGHRYIGSSVKLSRRWVSHQAALKGGYHHTTYLQRAWNKYGPDVFEFHVLFYCDPCQLHMWEQRCLDNLKHEYNGGNNAWGGRTTSPTREERERIGAAHRGKPLSAEHRKKLSLAKLGKVGNRLGSVVSEETKEKLRKWRATFVMSPETGKKIGAANRASYYSGNHRQAKLSMEKATMIRERRLSGERVCDLADEFGVSRATIHRVMTGKGWVEVSHA